MSMEQDIKLFVKVANDNAADLLKELAVTTDREIRTEQKGRRGIEPFMALVVDSKPATDLSSVKASSTVVELFDYRSEIVLACFQECRARAPFVSGAYRDGFFAIVDDRRYAPLVVPTPAALAEATTVVVTNSVPYARRLEVGKTKDGGWFVFRADPHIIEAASLVVKAEFGGVARIRFNWMEGVVRQTNKKSNRTSGKRSHEGKSKNRAPAIFIDLG